MHVIQKILSVLLFIAALVACCFSWMLFDQREILKERLLVLESHVRGTADAAKWCDYEIQPPDLKDRPDLFGQWPLERRSERALLKRDLQDYQRLHKPLDLLRDAVRDRQRSLEDSKRRHDDLRRDLSHAEEKFLMCSQDLTHSRDRRADLEEALDTARADYRLKLREMDRLESEMLEERQVVARLEDTLRQRAARVAGLETELDEANEYAADLHAALRDCVDPDPRSGGQFAISAVEQDWNFVVIPLGPGETVIPATEGIIHRDEKLIGKAVVQRVEKNYAIAQILGQWARADVRPGDQIMF